MIVLGCGSNLGDRIANLRNALAKIKNISGIAVKQVSPVYISEAQLPNNDAPNTWHNEYLNVAIRCETTLHPLELLKAVKKIEKENGRDLNSARWSPRVIDIDILSYDNLVIDNTTLTIPHRELINRPFALWPFADVLPNWQYPHSPYLQMTAAQIVEKWGSRFDGNAPFKTRQIAQRIDTPQLIGILNLTPDSFSDGGNFSSLENAQKQAKNLVESGADIIDIGAESTSPIAKPITPEIEWMRLQPVLSAIKEMRFTLPPKISVDTRNVYVAEKALTLGVDWINDVSGLDDIKMRSLVAEAKVHCVMMHHLSIPEDRNLNVPRNENIAQVILAWGKSRLNELLESKIEIDKIIFDPGIGFGKMAEQSLLSLKNLDDLKELQLPILIGHSRKSFFSLFTDKSFQERDIETLATSLYLSEQPVNYIRVHNVDMTARGLKVLKSLSHD